MKHRHVPQRRKTALWLCLELFLLVNRAKTGNMVSETAAKEAKKAKQATKKQPSQSTKAPVKAAAKQKIAKPMKISAPRVGGKR